MGISPENSNYTDKGIHTSFWERNLNYPQYILRNYHYTCVPELLQKIDLKDLVLKAAINILLKHLKITISHLMT